MLLIFEYFNCHNAYNILDICSLSLKKLPALLATKHSCIFERKTKWFSYEFRLSRGRLYLT